MRNCTECTQKSPGCRSGCEEYAIREIIEALLLPEKRITEQLSADLRGIKQGDITRNLRKRSQSRRR